MIGETHGLIDTNILILVDRLNTGQLPTVMLVSAVTLAELAAGAHRTDDPVERARRLDRLQRVESAFEPLPFDTEAARAYGQVFAAVLAAGRNSRGRFADLMMASVALANGLPLYTTNPRDFKGLEHLLTVVAVDHPGH